MKKAKKAGRRAQGAAPNAASAPKKGGPAGTPAGAADPQARFAQALGDHRAGRREDAAAGYRVVLARDPGHPHALNNLAVLMRAERRLDEALALYRRALEQSPEEPSVHSNMGCVLIDQGRKAEAAAVLRGALVLRPDYSDALFNLGNCLHSLGDGDGAMAAYRRALRVNPAMGEAHTGLGDLHRERNELGSAVDCYVAALKQRPGMLEAYNNLGEVLKDQGRLGEAAAVIQEGMRHHPDNALMHGNLLLLLHYSAGLAPEAIHRAHVGWDERHARPLLPAVPRFANDRAPGRRLRVGYVSPDFCTHSCAYFSEPLLSAHDRAAVEIVCYPVSGRHDRMTERFQSLSDLWRPLVGMSDEEAAAAIRQDRIDILVDMAGHTGGNRLSVFARKPAPIQVTWLGYPDTTGMAAMDYRLTDAIADPVGGADARASERLVRLEGGFLAFRPVVDAPLAEAPPALVAGHVTFGSFNNLTKVPSNVVRVWAEILRRVPGSRLILKSRALGDPPTLARYAQMFAACGVEPGRVDLLARIEAVEGHLRAYDRLDIGLDPFPYNGTTTTCEALWMGVPVVTWLGTHHVARVGGSLLTHCGLEELVARDEAGYVDAAVALANDLPRLAGLRRSMRSRLERSSLTDHTGFARKVEAAYRGFWHEWIARNPG
ncbi:O-linked N-acetylglucosamine transferase, SPINDLY family protein [Azospirillum doebereinerae]